MSAQQIRTARRAFIAARTAEILSDYPAMSTRSAMAMARAEWGDEQ